MAKLYFRYGAMNSGKSTALLQAAFNYEERGHRGAAREARDRHQGRPRHRVAGSAWCARSTSRSRPTRRARHASSSSATAVIEEHGRDVSCLLVDEAQFLSSEQVDDLLRIALIDNVPVLAYGIRTDFQTVAFPGSRRLLEIVAQPRGAEDHLPLRSQGDLQRATHRRRFVFDGDQVAIDGETVTYESLCGVCYLEESGGVLNGHPTPVG